MKQAFQLAPPRDVWPCRKCGEPELPHHPGCFWAEHQQGAVQGMRYAWTPAEAKLGAIIEQQEDEAEALGVALAEMTRRRNFWRAICIGIVVGFYAALCIATFAELVL